MWWHSSSTYKGIYIGDHQRQFCENLKNNKKNTPMVRTTPNTVKSIRIRPEEIKMMKRFSSSCIEDQTLKNQKQVFSQSNKKHNP